MKLSAKITLSVVLIVSLAVAIGGLRHRLLGVPFPNDPSNYHCGG